MLEAEGFETGAGPWTVAGPSQGSPPNSTAWEIGPKLIDFYAGTSTEEALLLGFGGEQLATEAGGRTCCAARSADARTGCRPPAGTPYR